MATAQIDFNLYYRATESGTKYGDVDPKSNSAWTTDREQAIEAAGELLALHGRTKFIRIQSVVLHDGQAIELNAQRDAMFAQD